MSRPANVDAFCCALFAALFVALIGLCLLTQSGCWIKNGIDLEGHIRPAKPNVPPVPAVPAPPPPPKDDWAPPWFRRPQPKNRGLSISVPSAATNDIRDDVAAVSMTLATTAAREEAVNPAAVASLPQLEKVAENSNTPAANWSTLQLDMLTANNGIRAAAGKPPQSLDERLCRAAQEQADYLASTGRFDHHVNGNPRTRAAKYGFPVRDFTSLEVRENLAGDFQNIHNAFCGWCGSAGHYAAIVSDCNLCGFGMAHGRTGNVWCGVYGRETQVAQ